MIIFNSTIYQIDRGLEYIHRQTYPNQLKSSGRDLQEFDWYQQTLVNIQVQ